MSAHAPPNRLAAVSSTAWSRLASGTSSRVVMAQPWPAWEQIVNPANMAASSISASSMTMNADLPPSARNTFFTVWLAAAMMRRPVAVEPVKLTMSTRGSVTSTSPTSLDAEVRTLTTPGGMSVSATSRPSAAVIHGVWGGPFTTTVQPAASAGTSFASVIWTG